MRLTTKGKVAVSAMLDLALCDQGRPVRLSSLSARLQVSVSYLEQMFAKLRRNGLVLAARGPHGGYFLARRAADIAIADVVGAVGNPRLGQRASDGVFKPPEQVDVDALWASADRLIVDFLGAVSLQRLLDEGPAALRSQNADRSAGLP